VAKLLHIVDAQAPYELLLQLAAVVGEQDEIVSVGPPPALPELARPIEPHHVPFGRPGLCGRRMAGRAARADAIHAWSEPAALAALEAGKRTGRPACLSLHRAPSAEELGEVLLAARMGLVHPVVHTRRVRAALIRMLMPKTVVTVVPLAAAAPDARGERRRRTREALGVRDEQFLLVAPAALARDAGHRYATWATAIVGHIIDNVHLLVPGRGPALRSVAFFARNTGYGDRMHFTEGRLPLVDALSAADAAVFLPRRDAGLSSLAAALAAGLPVVASETPDAAELIGDGEAVAWVPPRSPREAAHVFLRLAEDREFRSRMSAAARAAAPAFAPAACRAALDAFYDRLAAAQPIGSA